jgi:hypothetical protein
MADQIEPESNHRRTNIDAAFARVRTKIDLAVRDLTIRMVAGAVVLFVALALLKFFC